MLFIHKINVCNSNGFNMCASMSGSCSRIISKAARQNSVVQSPVVCGNRILQCLGPVSRNSRYLSGPENYSVGAQYYPIAIQFLLILKDKY